MNAPQQVFRIRRSYNQWVANQTLEDYSLRFTAKAARKWSCSRVALTALGSISFLALEAIGGTITLTYGFENALAAILVVGLIILLTGLPISYFAAKQGVDIDLLTRGAGFGYIGSTITSLIYASFTFIFFALEAAILALAMELTLNIPVSIGYIISSIVVIPLVTHGITLISRFQVWTQPFWLIFQALPLVFILYNIDEAVTLWTSFEAPSDSSFAGVASSGFSILAFGAAASVLFSLIAQIGEQVDFLRFLPEKTKENRKEWWLAMLSSGPGWIIVGTVKILIGSFLAVFALNYGLPAEKAADPNHMYLVAFERITQSPELSLVLLGIFVLISQLKINVTNAYAGSIAWSNFFSRITHNHPGRVVWVVFNVGIALMLMELGIYRILEEILGSYAIIALAWVGTIVADLTINRHFGLRPKELDFKRAHLFDINPVGMGSMIISSALGFAAHVGWLGETASALSSFVALGATFVCAPFLAWLTDGKFYIARDPVIFSTKEPVKCCICDHHFEPEDMTHCPAYEGTICSLCCSLDARCGDMCKERSKLSDQLSDAFGRFLPESWVAAINSRIGHFIGLFLLTIFIIATALSLVYFQISFESSSASWVTKDAIAHALITVFFILVIIFGVVAWMFSLAHDSRMVATNETIDQTNRLREEIEAHQITDAALQLAKEQADNANQAKSRYLTGIGHELRSPLNAIMGYAQLLEKDLAIPEERRGALSTIRRSSEHLADLIEGLLDISRIEAGRLEIQYSDVELEEFMNQLVSMFRMHANESNIAFKYEQTSPLPKVVKTDKKRLRQILINLVSNAIKYTTEGGVTLKVGYRNQVAEFRVEDTGRGISEEAFEQIFQPFHRIKSERFPNPAGTGLGLTITRLLVDIMGGDIQVSSEPGVGSVFTVTVMLASVNAPVSDTKPEKTISGYRGETRHVFTVDDEVAHRTMLMELLTPLGFEVTLAQDAEACLDMLELCQTDPDIFLLDVSMPGMDGWQLAERLRAKLPNATIIMASANANVNSTVDPDPSDGYLVKPIQHSELFMTLQKCTDIEWQYLEDSKRPESAPKRPALSDTPLPQTKSLVLSADVKQELIRLAQIGYANGIKSKLSLVQQPQDGASLTETEQEVVSTLRRMAERFEFGQMIQYLEDLK